jgi:RNA polymerase sigma factor (sigma-70 family)
LDIDLALFQNRELIRRFNQGDTYALQEMYDLYKKDMMTLATGLLFEKAWAEDVLHEVFASLISLQGRLHINSTLRGYLLQAVANQARTANRIKARKNPVPIDALCGSPPAVDSPERAVMRAEQRHHLEQALGRLPYEQREVVLLRHHGQVKFSAIAKFQGVSMSAVQARYRYGLEKLRSLLGSDL